MFVNRPSVFKTIQVLSRQNFKKTMSGTLDKTNSVMRYSAIIGAPPSRKLSFGAKIVLGIGFGALFMAGYGLGQISLKVFELIYAYNEKQPQKYRRNQFIELDTLKDRIDCMQTELNRELFEQNMLLKDQSKALENMKKRLDSEKFGHCIGTKDLDILVETYKIRLEQRSQGLATQFSSKDDTEHVVKVVQKDCFSLCSEMIKALKTTIA